jgi:hypothetical protein
MIAVALDQGKCTEGVLALASGARSAVLEQEQIQLKGCRPVDDGCDFPFESIPWGESKIIQTRVPFGVMTAEAVLRELVGYCFCMVHGIPCAVAPICIYSYTGTMTGRYCLVQRAPKGRRVESFLRIKGVMVSDMLAQTTSDESCLLGSEATLEGLNCRWYAEQKARWLVEFHFSGGFRGLLNNNVGNDVVEWLPNKKCRLCFCDFDSFKLADIPSQPVPAFLDAFATQCLVEIVKGSLPILFYVKVPLGSAEKNCSRYIAAAYRQKSTLWNLYKQKAFLKAHQLSWSWPELDAAFGRAFETPAFLEAACSVILSDYALRRHHQRHTRIYVPH